MNVPLPMLDNSLDSSLNTLKMWLRLLPDTLKGDEPDTVSFGGALALILFDYYTPAIPLEAAASAIDYFEDVLRTLGDELQVGLSESPVRLPYAKFALVDAQLLTCTWDRQNPPFSIESGCAQPVLYPPLNEHGLFIIAVFMKTLASQLGFTEVRAAFYRLRRFDGLAVENDSEIDPTSPDPAPGVAADSVA